MKRFSTILLLTSLLVITMWQMLDNKSVSAAPLAGSGKYNDGNPDTVDMSVLFMFCQPQL